MLVQSPVNIYWMSKEKNSVPWSYGLKGHELSKLSCLGCLSSFCKYCNESFFSIYRIMPLSIADLVIIMRHDDMAVNRKLVQFLFIHFIIFFFHLAGGYFLKQWSLWVKMKVSREFVSFPLIARCIYFA